MAMHNLACSGCGASMRYDASAEALEAAVGLALLAVLLVLGIIAAAAGG